MSVAIKIIASISILLCTSLVGYVKVAKMGKRIKTLLSIKNAFSILESEINFSSNKLKTAFLTISKATDSNLQAFFKQISDNIATQSGDKVWQEALDNFSLELCLAKSDVEMLKPFGIELGITDRVNQIKNIKNSIALVDMQYEKAKNEYSSNAKIYRNLGFLSGLAVVILLF